MGDTANHKRCVWLISDEMIARLDRWGAQHGIASQVESARRLLDMGLQHQDTAADLLVRMHERVAGGRAIREVVGHVLIPHPRVVSVKFHDGDVVSFTMTDGVESWFPEPRA